MWSVLRDEVFDDLFSVFVGSGTNVIASLIAPTNLFIATACMMSIQGESSVV
jgi:hypothetical protein